MDTNVKDSGGQEPRVRGTTNQAAGFRTGGKGYWAGLNIPRTGHSPSGLSGLGVLVQSRGILKVLGICCEVSTGVWVNSARVACVSVLKVGR
jgi:hypothetical protein